MQLPETCGARVHVEATTRLQLPRHGSGCLVARPVVKGNSRRSIVFHMLVLGGKGHAPIARPVARTIAAIPPHPGARASLTATARRCLLKPPHLVREQGDTNRAQPA